MDEFNSCSLNVLVSSSNLYGVNIASYCILTPNDRSIEIFDTGLLDKKELIKLLNIAIGPIIQIMHSKIKEQPKTTFYHAQIFSPSGLA